MKKIIMFDEKLKPFNLKQISGIRFIVSKNNKVKKISKIILLIGWLVGMFMVINNGNNIIGWIIVFGFAILYKLEER